MNRKWSLLALAALAALSITATAAADQDRIRPGLTPKELVPVPDPVPVPRPWPPEPSDQPLSIDVWVRGGEGRVYRPGESVVIYFRASRDCFVFLYDVDTEGRVHRLFPRSPWDSESVEGGVTYAVPERRAGYRLVVEGPPGIETVVATASDLPLSDRWDACWDGVAGAWDYDQLGGTRHRVGRIFGDRRVGIDRLQRQLVEVPGDEYYGPDASVDQVSFRVGSWYGDTWDRYGRSIPGRYGPPPRYRFRGDFENRAR